MSLSCKDLVRRDTLPFLQWFHHLITIFSLCSHLSINTYDFVILTNCLCHSALATLRTNIALIWKIDKFFLQISYLSQFHLSVVGNNFKDLFDGLSCNYLSWVPPSNCDFRRRLAVNFLKIRQSFYVISFYV